MKEELTIRVAKPEDAKGLLEIYAPYVEKTAITFEYEVPSEEEFTGRCIQRAYLGSEGNVRRTDPSYSDEIPISGVGRKRGAVGVCVCRDI